MNNYLWCAKEETAGFKLETVYATVLKSMKLQNLSQIVYFFYCCQIFVDLISIWIKFYFTVISYLKDLITYIL